jgi:ribosomal protein S18 acetylase RimI-like enzyme
MSVFDPRVIPCPPENQADALSILYQRVSEPLRDHLINQVIAEARRGEVDLSGLWIARERDGRLTGALLTQTLAGRAAAVWAPEVKRSWGRGALAAELVRTALRDLEARGFRLAQAVLDESAGPRARRDLTRGGMPWVTHLLYFERDTTTPLLWHDEEHIEKARPVEPILDWRPFEPAIEAEFVRALLATYIGSLDMPELSGSRGPDDILEGHRAAGRFVPERWQLGCVHGDPDSAAVLLLASHPDRDAWEIVYLGLTPPARGKGLGRVVLRHALGLAHGAVARLELAADERNEPALRLYRGAGFQLRERRAVHLAVLDGHA